MARGELAGVAAGGARYVDLALIQADMPHLQAPQLSGVEALVDHQAKEHGIANLHWTPPITLGPV